MPAGARFLKVPINFWPGELFYVCRVFTRDQSFNNFENYTMKLSKKKQIDWFVR